MLLTNEKIASDRKIWETFDFDDDYPGMTPGSLFDSMTYQERLEIVNLTFPNDEKSNNGCDCRIGCNTCLTLEN